MQINNNREMRALEDRMKATVREADAAQTAYLDAVTGFKLCPNQLCGKFKAPCPVECGQCNGTGWVKK